MKPAAQFFLLAGLTVLLIQAGCAGGEADDIGGEAIAAVERWDRSTDWIDCSEAWVIDVVNSPYRLDYALQADCRYETTPTRGVYAAASYFRVSFERRSFGGWEPVRCERVSHPDAVRAWRRGQPHDGPSPVLEIMEHLTATVTLPAAVICAVLLGGALLWHWRRR